MTDNVYKILPQFIKVQKEDDTSYIFKFPDDNSGGQLKNTGDGTLSYEDSEEYIVKDEKPIGTNGGTFTNNTWVTRDLNTLIKSPSSSTNITLTNNEFTLEEGKYDISVKAPCHRVGENQCRLYNVTTSSIETYGLNNYADKNSNASSSISILEHICELSTQTTFRIEHMCNNTKSNFGLGLASGYGTEVYTIVTIRKIC